MKLYQKLTLTLALLAPLTSNVQACTSRIVDWSSSSKTYNSLVAEYQNNNFVAVEAALNCLVQSKKTHPNGKPGSILASYFFGNEFSPSGSDQGHKLIIERWKATVKNAPYASLAEAYLLHAEAWRARGGEVASKTSKSQFKTFKEKLKLTELALRSEKNQLKDNPLSYNLLVRVTSDLYGISKPVNEVFNKGIAKWPKHYEFYRSILGKKIPVWGGSWEEIETLISRWSEKRKKEEGTSLYARLYYIVHLDNNLDPRKTKVDWAKLKPALINLYSQYPTKTHYTMAASYGCLFDQSFYKQITAKHGHMLRPPAYWVGGTSLEKCNAFYASLTDQSKQQKK